MPAVEVGGRAIFHLGGPGGAPGATPLVCLHGAGGTGATWAPLHAALRQTRPFYALDLPGHGRSAPLEGPIRIEAYAEAVVGFLDAAGLASAILVGHSMGGAVALLAALAAPARVAGLVLAGTGARLRVAPDLLAAIVADPEAAAERICRLCYGPAAPPDSVARGIAEMRRTRAAVLEGDFRACDVFDVRARLGEVRAPALVAVGDHDVMAPPRYAAFLADHLPRAALRVFPGAGHMLPVEAPVAFAAAVGEFAAGL